MTPEQIEAGLQKTLDKFKQDPQFELRQELGGMLFRHIDSFTPQERKRYDELLQLLTTQP